MPPLVTGSIVSAVELHVLNGERHLVKKTMKFAGVQVYKIQVQANPHSTIPLFTLILRPINNKIAAKLFLF